MNMESSLFSDAHKFTPSAEQATLAAAALGSAALLWATKGREIAAVVAVAEETILPRISARMLSTAVKKDGLAIFKDGETQMVSGHAANTMPSMPTISPPKITEGVPPYGRSAADQAKFDLAESSRNAAYKAQERDEAVRAVASATRKQMEESGVVMRHPVTGQPLTANETHYSVYVDSLPRKTTLEFAEDGKLMPGIYRMNVEQFKALFAGGHRRERLMGNFEQALTALQRGGVEEVHVGGSFVTKKASPSDIDFIWNPHAKPFNREAVQSFDYGALLHHQSPALRNRGLQMMITPPENGTYKGMINFLAHERSSWPIRSRGMWRTGGTDIPKGLVEIDLRALPKS